MQRKMQVCGDVSGYAKPGDAGIDLKAQTFGGKEIDSVAVMPGEIMMVGTGVKCAIPTGCFGMLVPRSGIAAKRGLSLVNSPGIIDSGYRGEICAPIVNHGSKAAVIDRGERVCQLVIVPYVQCSIEVVGELDETERGDGGFGSTGV